MHAQSAFVDGTLLEAAVPDVRVLRLEHEGRRWAGLAVVDQGGTRATIVHFTDLCGVDAFDEALGAVREYLSESGASPIPLGNPSALGSDLNLPREGSPR